MVRRWLFIGYFLIHSSPSPAQVDWAYRGGGADALAPRGWEAFVGPLKLKAKLLTGFHQIPNQVALELKPEAAKPDLYLCHSVQRCKSCES
jgi:hypothetical protein